MRSTGRDSDRHYEIAAYQGLTSMARGLGERQIVARLQANLADEKEALRGLEKIGRRLSKSTTKAVNGR